MRINDIIDRYFEGVSSCEDERMLKEYFADADNISEDLLYLKPMFNYLCDEVEALNILAEIKSEEQRIKAKQVKLKSRTKRFVVLVSSVAASLVIGLVLLFSYLDSGGMSGNYVWVDGQKITNIDVVNKYAEESFTQMSSVDNVLESQLDSFFE